MGLAYDLDSQARPLIDDWAKVIVLGALELGQITGQDRLSGITVPAADSTDFDVIIRSCTYAKDCYIITGSYKADFTGTGATVGFAYDGFVTIIRANNQTMVEGDLTGALGEDNPNYYINPGVNLTTGAVRKQPFDQYNLYYTYVCRMPVELDASGNGGFAEPPEDDTTPGIYACDVIKGSADAAFTLAIGGHQRINSTAAGSFGKIGYSGYMAVLIFDQLNPTLVPSATMGGLEADQRWSLIFNASSSIQISFDGASKTGAGLTDINAYPNEGRDLQSYCTTQALTAGSWSPVDLESLGNGYIIQRIYDVVCLNTGSQPLGLETNTVWTCGEAIYSDGAGGIDFNTAYLMQWDWKGSTAYPNPMVNVAEFPGIQNWAVANDVPGYNFKGTRAVTMTPTFNVSATQDPSSNQIMVGIEGVDHSGKTYAEIYAANWKAIFQSVDFLGSRHFGLWPFAVAGSSFPTATGFELPKRWVGKAIQQRTYTQDEEAVAKNLTAWETQDGIDPATGAGPLFAWQDRTLLQTLQRDPTVSNAQIAQNPLSFLTPYLAPNFLDYGLSNKPAFTGQPANIAYGFLGFGETGFGDGPSIFMYDFGTITMGAEQTPPNTFYVGPWSGDPLKAGLNIISVGPSINDAIEQNTGSKTSRYPLSAGWDVDRDQWVFTFGLTGATNGATVLSCNSAFNEQPSNQIAYLDQTDQFGTLASNATGAIYLPRNMSPYLDGLVIFGNSSWDISTEGPPSLSVFKPDNATASDKVFQVYELQGTTGRTAAVWIDYTLFDGIDSLVATIVQELGLRVTVENVEWYKRKILNNDVLNMTSEEVEAWIQTQQAEYRKMLIDKERQGRLRRRRKQQSAVANDLEDLIQGEFVVSNMDFIEGDFIENNLKDITGLPDQDAQLANQVLNDPQWLQGESLYGQDTARRKTAGERKKSPKSGKKSSDDDAGEA